MERYLNKFYNIVDKIGKRNVILIIFIFIVLLITGLYQTFSLYTESEGLSIIDGISTYKFILTANDENAVTIAAGNSKNLMITVTNPEKTKLKYGIYYSSDDDLSSVNIGYKTSSEYTGNGTIDSNSDYIIEAKVYNNSSDDVTINFGLKYGLENGGDLTLDSGQYWLEEYVEPVIISEYIQDLYNDGSTLTTVNIGGSTSNPSVSLNNTQLIMLDNNGEYRYYGNNPNNYVEFNGELWRIISVSNVKSSSSDTTGEMRVKIIRNESIGDYSWDSSDSTVNSGYGVNDWTQADLMTELNDLYYNQQSGTCYNGTSNASTTCDFTSIGLNSTAKSMIGDTVWYLGDGIYDGSDLSVNAVYNNERSSNVYGDNPTTWAGIVGLLYPSDYGYATDLSACTADMANYGSTSSCVENNWMSYMNYQWSITPLYSDSIAVYPISGTMVAASSGYAKNAEAIRPVVYLNADVTIVGGTGTNGDPYQLSVEAIGDAFIKKVLKANAQSDADIDFSVVSSTSGTNGIYLRNGTENDTNPIYYYRGAVDNNLIFANVCWKIVRTTSTGGLKLIYNGTPTDGQCDNTGTASQIGTKKFNSSYNSPAYVGYMYSSPYTDTAKTMTSITDTYYYGNDVTYSNGTYTLTDTITNSDWSTIYNGGLNNNHYTCFSTETTCDSVYYVYFTNDSKAYYITLTNGKKVEDALVDMLGADDSNTSNYNTTSSTIKGNSTTSGTIDYWYYNKIEQKGYSDYLEDTVWCNDRTISEKNGWDPDGGSTTAYLNFSSNRRVYTTYEPSLECSRTIDSFTVSETNGNGDLDYPVGLLTADEIMLAGGRNAANDTYYLYTGQDYWGGSPSYLSTASASGFYVYTSGYFGKSTVNNSIGVRPSVSLKSGFLISEGNGTTANPYVVSTD